MSIRMMQRAEIGLIVIACALASTDTAHAQMRFSGQPLPQCRSFWLTECTWSYRLGHASDLDREPVDQIKGENSRLYIAWEVGHMWNVSPRSAIGGALIYGVDYGGARLGINGRYRYWLGAPSLVNRQWSLEATAGLLLLGGTDLNFSNRRRQEFPTPIASLALTWGDRVSMVSRVEALRRQILPTDDGKYETNVAWYSGLKFGSWPGVVVGTCSLLTVWAVHSLAD